MYQLNDRSKASILKRTGLTFEQIQSMSLEEIERHIEKKIGRKLELKMPKNHYLQTTVRGSVWLFLNRINNFKKESKILSKI